MNLTTKARQFGPEFHLIHLVFPNLGKGLPIYFRELACGVATAITVSALLFPALLLMHIALPWSSPPNFLFLAQITAYTSVFAAVFSRLMAIAYLHARSSRYRWQSPALVVALFLPSYLLGIVLLNDFMKVSSVGFPVGAMIVALPGYLIGIWYAKRNFERPDAK